jgi:stage II sporulation protein R
VAKLISAGGLKMGMKMNKMHFFKLYKISNRSSINTDSSLEIPYPIVHRYKYFAMIIAFLSLSVYFLVQAFFVDAVSQTDMQEDIASEIIRFHVIANSDIEEDQALKLKVKTALIDALAPTLNQVNSVDEARDILNANLPQMEDLANQVIKDNGFSYTANASMEQGYFPLKVYGDLSLPPGKYEAVRIEIGSAKGQNWWCIMFPPLCFVDATYSVVPEDSKEQLKQVLTEEEYDAVFAEGKPDIKVKFKLISILKSLFSD